MTESKIQDNTYYDPGANRANRVRDLFDRIAGRYDLINDVQSAGLHRWWKRRVIEEAGNLAGKKTLDICSGTGDLAFAMAERGAQTTGLDFSQEMLFQAKEKAKNKQSLVSFDLPNFQQGDASELPFENDTFEVVTMAYGLRNLKDWKKGLSELHRVTRPGGRMLILDFGKPPNPVWRSIYFNYLKLIVPLMGWSLAGDAEAYQYILTSLQHFPAQRGIESEMIRLNSRLVRTHLFMGGVMSLNMGIKSQT
ncbi:MAG: ubiquinone/menaquinone biosynthesis methyltransferase [Verrucomicrobia bacterium]|jgi:demethylmenaquinone methyltransferase / 2-methoxy-6-polyprenyl-1,4-benzoquinol methylase|nr:ubiquinone/menaquinone biosynthesis methyltransferase [Verrucomicrobiota bacterium]